MTVQNMNCNIVMIKRPPCFFSILNIVRIGDIRTVKLSQWVLTPTPWTGTPGSPYSHIGVGVYRYTRESLHRSRSIQVCQGVLTQELEYRGIPGSPYTWVGVYRYTRESLHRSWSIQVYQGVLTQELECTGIPWSPYTGVGVYQGVLTQNLEYTGIPGSPYTGVGVYRYTRESLHKSWSIQVYQGVLKQELKYTGIPGSPYTGVEVYRYIRESLHRSWSIQVYQGVHTQELEYTCFNFKTFVYLYNNIKRIFRKEIEYLAQNQIF